jgi:hypothetical protein
METPPLDIAFVDFARGDVRKAIAIRRKALGERHPNVGTSLALKALLQLLEKGCPPAAGRSRSRSTSRAGP